MKKIYFLGLFLLIFSFFMLIFPKSATAEIEGYSVNLSCYVAQTEGGELQETSAFSQSTRTLTMDYSEFMNGGYIYLSADLVANAEVTTPVGPIYSWAIDKVIVSNAKNLTLHSNYTLENITEPQIKVGSTKIILTVSDANSTKQTSVDILINITDTNSSLTMKCATSNIPNGLDNSVTDLNFYATIPTTSKLISYMWQLKTPKSTTYLTASNTNSYTFSRMAMIGNYGYGEYKLIAIGKDSKTNTIYYSKTYTLFVKPNDFVVAPGAYKLVTTAVKNSLTNIEAFKYALSDTTNLIPENVYWYINDQKVASGLTFTYEPTTRDEYKLSVKYLQHEDGIPLELITPIKQTPKTTEVYFMYITIGTVVLAVGIILFISIKVSNKKRDVIW